MGAKRQVQKWTVQQVAAWIEEITGKPTSDAVARARMTQLDLQPTYELVNGRERAMWESTAVKKAVPKERSPSGPWKKLETKPEWTTAELAEWWSGYSGKDKSDATARSKMSQLGIDSNPGKVGGRVVALWDSALAIEKIKGAPGQGGPGKPRPARGTA